MYGLFNELVKFVEVDKALHQVWSDEDKKKYKVPKFRVFRSGWHCPEAGLAHLDWEASLVWTKDEVGKNSKLIGKPTYQAEVAKEIKEIYVWWKEVRPKRLDPMDESGWSAYCDEQHNKLKEKEPDVEGIDAILWNTEKTKEEQKKSNAIHKKWQKIEKQQNDEDTDMMIRLIRIRHQLWS